MCVKYALEKTDNYGMLRSPTVRIGTLRMDLGPERIIPSHAFSPDLFGFQTQICDRNPNDWAFERSDFGHFG